ncbi:MAG: AI-2E family transporter, partial [Chloroflexi bacterium]
MSNPTPPSLTSPPWSTASKRLIALGAVLALYLFLRRVDQSVFLTIAITFILAYMLSPVVTFFERRMRGIQSYGTRRSISVLMTWLLVIGAIAAFIALVVPVIFVQLRAFAEDLPDLLQNTEADLKETLNKRFRIGEYTINPWEELEQL